MPSAYPQNAVAVGPTTVGSAINQLDHECKRLVEIRERTALMAAELRSFTDKVLGVEAEPPCKVEGQRSASSLIEAIRYTITDTDELLSAIEKQMRRLVAN